MVFSLGVKTLPDIIDEIANSLITSVDPTDGLNHWTDVDTTWDTVDRTALKARRAMKYVKGTEVIYLALESRNTWYANYDGHAAKGLRVTFSATWDIVNHTYGTTVQQSSIPFEDYSGIAQPITDLATEILTYYLWTESNGFVIIAKPEPTTANLQNSFFIAIERNQNKEYADGYSNFYCFNVMNIWPTFARIGYTYGDIHRSFLRPFAYEWPNIQTTTVHPFYYCMTSGTMERYNAFLATADKKVYYRKPIVSNNKIEPGQANIALAPIFNVELWFLWSEMAGLVDGDIIQVEGTTKKFLCKSLDSPDSINRVTYAIKYSD
jgi:hypothetical protein